MKNNRDHQRKNCCEYIKGPDFPTGGIVVNKDELPSIYRNADQERYDPRAKVEIEKGKGGKESPGHYGDPLYHDGSQHRQVPE